MRLSLQNGAHLSAAKGLDPHYAERGGVLVVLADGTGTPEPPTPEIQEIGV